MKRSIQQEIDMRKLEIEHQWSYLKSRLNKLSEAEANTLKVVKEQAKKYGVSLK